MKKSKKKEFKYLRQILIPCLSVVAASSVVIPMSILCAQPQHISRDANYRELSWSLKKHPGDKDVKFTFPFTAIDKDFDIEKLSCEWEYTSSSHRNCTITTDKLSPVAPNSKMTGNVFLTAHLIKIDKTDLKSGDKMSFNVHFIYKDDLGKVLWTCDFCNNYIVVTA